MLRVVLVALVVFATIYAFVDCVQTDRRLVRIMPKAVWLIAGRADARGGRAPGGPRGPRGPSRPPGPMGPDDDPDFLRKL